MLSCNKGISLVRNVGIICSSMLNAVNVRHSVQPVQSSRQLHAAWTILLNHHWLYRATAHAGSETQIKYEETDLSLEGVPTVLLLHGAGTDLSQCRPLSERLIRAATSMESSAATKPLLQCLLVDLRGSGKSDGDDYEPPHDIATSTEDVINLVQAVCPDPYVPSPAIVVGVGGLGGAIAHCYANLTRRRERTTVTHSEISGAGAVRAPKAVVLLPDTPKESKEAPAAVHSCEVRRSVAESANAYGVFTKVTIERATIGAPNIHCVESEDEAVAKVLSLLTSPST